MSEKTEGTELIDIRTVSVDKSLPQNERVAEYMRQLKTPHRFKCGKFTVTERFLNGGPSIEECLVQLAGQTRC